MNETISLSLGGSYIVAPDNPRKTKNRGRKCMILAFEMTEDDVDIRVIYLDTQREVLLKFSDLKPITE
ncbi:hypothetical protein [Paenibacillus roseipurpureus]|uniref:Uncharacterized protein n=1 Tax=Paenibacillus roseopurpureus TaxID=2918901 RepID=A0AA96LLW9_9BACL|nr:hypothetical protein [Paenibacillus sp. MBLB1832]WNR44160.1 hypothetical protein MJB10_24185 [Paenibacillus sp. MBLB1832]